MTAELYPDTLNTFHKPVIDLKASGEKIKQLRLLKKMSVRDLQIMLG